MIFCAEKTIQINLLNKIMDQFTKDLLAINQIKNAAQLLEGEYFIQTVHDSSGRKVKRIIITFDDREI